jgi:hypothetical protein
MVQGEMDFIAFILDQNKVYNRLSNNNTTNQQYFYPEIVVVRKKNAARRQVEQVAPEAIQPER